MQGLRNQHWDIQFRSKKISFMAKNVTILIFKKSQEITKMLSMLLLIVLICYLLASFTLNTQFTYENGLTVIF